jgi:hypothetical protein
MAKSIPSVLERESSIRRKAVMEEEGFKFFMKVS